MKCLALRSETPSRTSPSVPLNRNWTFRFAKRGRTSGLNVFIGTSGAFACHSNGCQRSPLPCEACKRSVRLAVGVAEQLETRDHAETAEEDLVRARIPAHVIGFPRSVREIGQPIRPREERMRDARG